MSHLEASDLLYQQLESLTNVVKAANFPGSLEGLFAFHILETEAAFDLDWDVSNARHSWLEEHHLELEYFPVIAALGYSLYHGQQTTTSQVRGAFRRGVIKLQQRELFPDDGYSFINIPLTVIGIVLGTQVAFSEAEQAEVSNWLRNALQLRQHRTIEDFYQKLLYLYAGTHLDGLPVSLQVPTGSFRLEDLAFLEWGWHRGIFQVSVGYSDLSVLRKELLQAAVVTPMNYTEADKAAVVWSAIRSALTEQLQIRSEILETTRHLNFEAGIKEVRLKVVDLFPDLQLEFATLEARLLSLLDEEERFGTNSELRSERVRIVESLNRFCIKCFGKTFNQYCSIDIHSG